MTKKNLAGRVRTAAAIKADARVLAARVARAEVATTTSPSQEGGTVGELWLYGVVGGYWFGFNAESVSRALRNLDVDTLYVRIHSPGGHAGDGVAIANLLRNHKATVVTVVDGIAASAASVIAIAGDEVVMCPGSQMMLHDASMGTYGNAAQLRRDAEWIDKQSDNYAGVYALKAGGTAAAWRQVMLANEGEGTWYTADEAVSTKLADEVGTRVAAGSPPTTLDEQIDEDDDELMARIEHDLQLLDRAVHPAALAAWQGQAPSLPTASAGGPTPSNPEGAKLVDFNDEQIATLREQVGFPEDADAETITAAVIEALDERADVEPTTTAAAPAAAAPAPASAGTPAPDGTTVAIPAVAYAELQANAQAGAQAAEQLRLQQRDAFLDAHRDRFLPANREQWEAEYDRHPANTRAYLEKAPVLVPTSELGHSAPTAEAAGKDDGWFAQFATTPKGA